MNKIPYSDDVTDWGVVRREILTHRAFLASKAEFEQHIKKLNNRRRQLRKEKA